VRILTAQLLEDTNYEEAQLPRSSLSDDSRVAHDMGWGCAPECMGSGPYLPLEYLQTIQVQNLAFDRARVVQAEENTPFFYGGRFWCRRVGVDDEANVVYGILRIKLPRLSRGFNV
jgi:hypothetical protein